MNCARSHIQKISFQSNLEIKSFELHTSLRKWQQLCTDDQCFHIGAFLLLMHIGYIVESRVVQFGWTILRCPNGVGASLLLYDISCLLLYMNSTLLSKWICSGITREWKRNFDGLIKPGLGQSDAWRSGRGREELHNIGKVLNFSTEGLRHNSCMSMITKVGFCPTKPH